MIITSLVETVSIDAPTRLFVMVILAPSLCDLDLTLNTVYCTSTYLFNQLVEVVGKCACYFLLYLMQL